VGGCVLTIYIYIYTNEGVTHNYFEVSKNTTYRTNNKQKQMAKLKAIAEDDSKIRAQ